MKYETDVNRTSCFLFAAMAPQPAQAMHGFGGQFLAVKFTHLKVCCKRIIEDGEDGAIIVRSDSYTSVQTSL